MFVQAAGMLKKPDKYGGNTLLGFVLIHFRHRGAQQTESGDPQKGDRFGASLMLLKRGYRATRIRRATAIMPAGSASMLRGKQTLLIASESTVQIRRAKGTYLARLVRP
jgi:hypothetical protein